MFIIQIQSIKSHNWSPVTSTKVLLSYFPLPEGDEGKVLLRCLLVLLKGFFLLLSGTYGLLSLDASKLFQDSSDPISEILKLLSLILFLNLLIIAAYSPAVVYLQYNSIFVKISGASSIVTIEIDDSDPTSITSDDLTYSFSESFLLEEASE